MHPTDGNRQQSYTGAMKNKKGGGKGHVNPYQWQKHKQAKLPSERTGYNV